MDTSKRGKNIIVRNAVNSKDHTTLSPRSRPPAIVDTLGRAPDLLTVFAHHEEFAKLPSGARLRPYEARKKQMVNPVLNLPCRARSLTEATSTPKIKQGGANAMMKTFRAKAKSSTFARARAILGIDARATRPKSRPKRDAVRTESSR